MQTPTHVLISERQHLQPFSLGRKWGESSTELIKGWGTEGEKENFISLCPPPFRSFAASQQEGCLPLAVGQVQSPLHSQRSVE